MQVVAKQKPSKKRAQYRKIASQIRGADNAVFFDKKADMRDFSRIVREMGFRYRSYKKNGWWVWVE